MGVPHFFMEMQATATLITRIPLLSKSSRKGKKEGKLTPSCEVVKSLLKSYTIDDVTAEPTLKS